CLLSSKHPTTRSVRLKNPLASPTATITPPPAPPPTTTTTTRPTLVRAPPITASSVAAANVPRLPLVLSPRGPGNHSPRKPSSLLNVYCAPHHQSSPAPPPPPAPAPKQEIEDS